ncbi:glycosyltransferase [Carnobacterium divergens]|uniref:glycosyltransferase n=1 Tax=Carnobacterium divergens TaxID=2748 RepID=UPI0039AE977D
MHILHYTLGIPPYRTGGLTKYSIDLMEEELKLNHNIYLLFPGSYNSLTKANIKKRKKYQGINIFELVNPLPVPLLNGVSEAKKFMKPIKESIFLEFLIANKIQLVHVHTLMGLPKEFLTASKKLKLTIIYTTHDYYGLCPQTLVKPIGKLSKVCNINCITCGTNPLSFKMITVMQSKTYKFLKDTKFIKFLRTRKKIKDTNISENEIQTIHPYSVEENANQIKLRNYYLQMFELVDLFHFNSKVAKIEFKKFINCEGRVLSITHNSIRDCRKIKKFNVQEPLKILYLGPQNERKGFNLIYRTFENLRKDNIDGWHLSCYGENREPENYDTEFFSFNGRYSYEELSEIFDNTDLLIVPSIWKETFGFIVLEALSYGVPILLSTNVGSKDLVDNNVTAFMFDPNPVDLKIKIQELLKNRELINAANKNILNMKNVFDMTNHTKKILDLYIKAGCKE